MNERTTSSLAGSRRRLGGVVGGVVILGLLVVAATCTAARSPGASAWQNPLERWLPGLFPGRTRCCSGLKQIHLAVHAYALDAATADNPHSKR